MFHGVEGGEIGVEAFSNNEKVLNNLRAAMELYLDKIKQASGTGAELTITTDSILRILSQYADQIESIDEKEARASAQLRLMMLEGILSFLGGQRKTCKDCLRMCMEFARLSQRSEDDVFGELAHEVLSAADQIRQSEISQLN